MTPRGVNYQSIAQRGLWLSRRRCSLGWHRRCGAPTSRRWTSPRLRIPFSHPRRMTGERSVSNQSQRFTIYVMARHVRICRDASSPVNLLQPRAPSPALPPPIVPSPSQAQQADVAVHRPHTCGEVEVFRSEEARQGGEQSSKVKWLGTAR